MKRLRFFYSVSTAAIVSGLLQACADFPGSTPADASITANVKKAIAQHSDLGPPNRLYVDTRDGVVYLSGFVDDGLVTENAIAVAHNVRGVKRVESNVGVDK